MPNRANIKFGECCINYAFVINIAVFVTPYIQGWEVPIFWTIWFAILSIVLFIVGNRFLNKEDKENKPLPGKWKRIKVKKDTTVHIEEIN